MTTKSLKSRLNQTKLSLDLVDDEQEEPKKSMEMDEFVAFACSKFVCPYQVFVKKDVQRDDLIKLMKPEGILNKKKTMATEKLKLHTSDTEKTDETTSKEAGQGCDDDTLVITALYDTSNRLVELVLEDLPNTPRVLMQILGIIMPKYNVLTKVTIKRCKINKYTIYELSKAIQFTAVTDICLDGSPLPEANFALLLQNTGVSSLSLARCNINDVVCETLASELHYLQPAETRLVTLNLSSNRITDKGAEYLGLALRTNRHLRYLNLSDNRIGDEGAEYILRFLMAFPLSYEDIMARRKRYFDYQKSKNEIIMKYLNELETKSLDSTSFSKKKKDALFKQSLGKQSLSANSTTKRDTKPNNIEDLGYMRAENLACEMLGPLIDPYHFNFIKLINGYSYCVGNMTLCYLNLAYNNISLMTVKKLLVVVKYQSLTKKLSQHGLIRIGIEGNNLPTGCIETDLLYDYLNRNIAAFSPKYKNDLKGRARARSRISVLPEININKS